MKSQNYFFESHVLAKRIGSITNLLKYILAISTSATGWLVVWDHHFIACATDLWFRSDQAQILVLSWISSWSFIVRLGQLTLTKLELTAIEFKANIAVICIIINCLIFKRSYLLNGDLKHLTSNHFAGLEQITKELRNNSIFDTVRNYWLHWTFDCYISLSFN